MDREEREMWIKAKYLQLAFANTQEPWPPKKSDVVPNAPPVTTPAANAPTAAVVPTTAAPAATAPARPSTAAATASARPTPTASAEWNGSGSGSHSDSDGEQELGTMVGEGLKYKEDNFLTSANLCRWIINYNEIQIGQQVGTGSYGIVSRGKWKGVDVAVKRIIKQKLDERKMLEFRAEMAFLSELHHPNIVLFIGTHRTHRPHTHAHTRTRTRTHTHRTLMVGWWCRRVREAAESVHCDGVREAGLAQRSADGRERAAAVEPAHAHAALGGPGRELPPLALALHRPPRPQTLQPPRTPHTPNRARTRKHHRTHSTARVKANSLVIRWTRTGTSRWPTSGSRASKKRTPP